MRVLLRLLVRLLGPHFDRSHVVIQLLVSPVIGAGLAGMAAVKQFGYENPIVPGFVAGGAGAGLLAGMFLIWNDAKNHRTARSGLPKRPWTKRRVAKIIGIVFVLWFVLVPLVLVIWDKISGHR